MPSDVGGPGPFLRQQGIAAGMAKHHLDGPAYHRLFGCVRVPSGTELTPDVVARAAVAVVPGAVISHHSAARIYGAVVPDVPEVHFSVGHSSQRCRCQGLLVHVSANRHSVTRGSLVVTSPAQTFCDLADQLNLVDLVVCGDSLIHRGYLTLELALAFADQKATGARMLARRAARLLRSGAESAMETRVRLMLVLAGLPEPVVNLSLRGGSGSVIYRLDLSYPDLRLAVEYDGRQHAEDAHQWGRDITRREWLDDHQWRLLVLRAPDVYDAPWETVRRVAGSWPTLGTRSRCHCRLLPNLRCTSRGVPGRSLVRRDVCRRRARSQRPSHIRAHESRSGRACRGNSAGFLPSSEEIGHAEVVGTLQETLDRHVRKGTAPGVVAALGYADGQLDVSAAGDLALDSIVRIQSMTKAITTVATLRLIEQGRLALGDPVHRWLPELADRQVLRTPMADLDDTVAATAPITVEHLLTNMSGYGMALESSPLQDAMRDNKTEAGAAPVALGADAWVAALGELPLAFEPGTGWRYHHGFGLLGVLLSRLVSRPLGEHLREDIFAPLGMPDTGYAAKRASARRLVAAYRRSDDGNFEQVDPAGKGFYLEPSHLETSHAELVSTLGDYCVFANMLASGGTHKGEQFVDPTLLARMTSDQVPETAKTPESFLGGFWEGTGWGYGVAIETTGAHAGRYGWSGGLGTDFFVGPDGSFGVVLTQVEMDGPLFTLFGDVVALQQ